MTTHRLGLLALVLLSGACEDPKLDPPGDGDLDSDVGGDPGSSSSDNPDAGSATPPLQWDGPAVESTAPVWGGLAIEGLGGDACLAWFAMAGEQVECDHCELAFEVEWWGLDFTCGDVPGEMGGLQLQVYDDHLWVDGWDLGEAVSGGGRVYFASVEPLPTPYSYYGYIVY